MAASAAEKTRGKSGRQAVRRKRVSSREVALAVIALVLALTAVYFVCAWLEGRDRKPETRGDLSERFPDANTIEVDGITYVPRKNLTTMLLMGIDRDSDAVVSGFRNGGQADFLELMVVDSASKKVTLLPIDRDTMTPITILSVLGKKSGERVLQISLSHSFGDGKEQSCLLTSQAVSGLLLGIEIDDYISMNLDGIATLNDLAGGVTVTLEDDFSAVDPRMTPGVTLTLHGMQAEYFVRSRMSMQIGTNEARMARQKVYMDGLIDALRTGMRDESYIVSLFDGLNPYLQSSMNRGLMTNRIWSVRDYALETVELPGEHAIGSDGFMEFHPDEKALQEAVLALFYDVAK